MTKWEDNMEKMNTILSVVEWAGVPEALAQAFFGAIGATGQEHPRILGVVSSEETDENMRELQLNDKPFTIVQKGLVRTVHRVTLCRKHAVRSTWNCQMKIA